jgi:hypothetical protein
VSSEVTQSSVNFVFLASHVYFISFLRFTNKFVTFIMFAFDVFIFNTRSILQKRELGGLSKPHSVCGKTVTSWRLPLAGHFHKFGGTMNAYISLVIKAHGNCDLEGRKMSLGVIVAMDHQEVVRLGGGRS